MGHCDGDTRARQRSTSPCPRLVPVMGIRGRHVEGSDFKLSYAKKIPVMIR